MPTVCAWSAKPFEISLGDAVGTALFADTLVDELGDDLAWATSYSSNVFYAFSRVSSCADFSSPISSNGFATLVRSGAVSIGKKSSGRQYR